ncbi:MAG: rod shape-determining protein MreD [Lachnospiraceae bacterium]|nr:rod shape-determining protein MreD [Lachnospiraceae bacterium]
MAKTAKKVLIQTVLILAAYILHTSIFPNLAFNDISPNVLLLLTVFSSFEQGMNTGMVTGMVCGLLCDVFYGSVLGVYGLFYLLIGFFAGSMARFFYKDEYVFPIVVVAASDLLYNFVMYVTNFLLRGRFDFQYYFRCVILPELVYTLLLAVVCLPFIALLNRRLLRIDMKEKEETDVGNVQRVDEKDT